MAVTVAERRHDIGVLRSLGATRGQIAGLFTVEALVLGAAGSLPGIPLGVGLAELAIRLFGEELSSAFLNAGESFRAPTDARDRRGGRRRRHADGPVGRARPVHAGGLRRAGRRRPPRPSTAARRIRWAHRLTCVALVAAGVADRAGAPAPAQSDGAMVGLTLILVGLQLAMPIFAALLARLLQPPCRWLLGIEARLAADNLLRSPGRTGVVIGALAAGVALMFQTAGVGKSNEVPIREWLEEVIRADAFLFRGNPVSANSSMTPMEPTTRDDLQTIPGVERVVGLRFYRPEYGGTFILMVALDACDYQRGVQARGRHDSPRWTGWTGSPTGTTQSCRTTSRPSGRSRRGTPLPSPARGARWTFS